MAGRWLPATDDLGEASEALIHCFHPAFNHLGGHDLPDLPSVGVKSLHFSLESHVVDQGLQKHKTETSTRCLTDIYDYTPPEDHS